MRWKVNVSPFEAGLVVGLGAAVVQGFYGVIPPVAYGVCLVGHPRDLFNWVVNGLAGTHWPVALPSFMYPVLTVVGIMLGAALAARQHGELSIRPSKKKWKYFALGFLVINFGLIVDACPIRSVLLSAYGDAYGLVLWSCIIAGAVLATLSMRRGAKRRADGGVAT